MSNSSNSLPFYERVQRKNATQRALDITVLFLLLSLLSYRLLFFYNHGFSCLLVIAFLSELYFSFISGLTLNLKWSIVDNNMYPERLLKRVTELPPVDMFVTTADSTLEPPILTVNTVLSLLAVDYPANKLACYVSDDGCSLVTFYSLTEAAKFAKIWVPFCKKYSVQVRAPFRYFSNDSPTPHDNSREFLQEWKIMKDEYEKLRHKIEDAVQNTVPCDLTGDLSIFSNIDLKNHPPIVKVIWENKEGDTDGPPHLVYISREKRPKHPHHYKAGAMNVLTRVSGLMTNAPYMLNVDCDMFVNNPNIILHAMCVFLSPNTSDRQVAFVQSPQKFYDGPKDDPFGNQLIVLFHYSGHGISGIQGPLYGGTGCFHRRKVIYGLSPDDHEDNIIGRVSENELVESFGSSKDFVTSAAHALKDKTSEYFLNNLTSLAEAGNVVAGCGYEYATNWGQKIGWIYGSTTEDVLTGLVIHKKGWRSVLCSPDPPAFMGCAPIGGPASMTQQKRWATGLLEILFSENSPIFAPYPDKLQRRQRLSYLSVLIWGLRSISELCYALLPAYCIITNSHFLPKIQEAGALIPLSLFTIGILQQVLEYLGTGQSLRAWWNNHRMARITVMSVWFFSVLSVILKLLGLSETAFEVTKKESLSPSSSSDDHDHHDHRMTFDDSPVFVLGTTILLIQVVTLVLGLLQLGPRDGTGFGLGEVVCCVWVVLCFGPFFKALFLKGKYGIPLSTKCKSVALAFLFVHLCRQ